MSKARGGWGTSAARWWILALLLAVGGMAGMRLVPALLPVPEMTINIGDEGPVNRHAEGAGFFSFLGWRSPQQAEGKLARRGGQTATLGIAWASRLGQPLELDVIACSCGAAPAHLYVNDAAFPLVLDNTWRRYRVLVDPRPTIFQYDLFLRSESDGPIGPLLHQVTARAPSPSAGLLGTLWIGLVVAAIVALDRRAMRLSRLAWPAAVVAAAIGARILYQPQLLTWGSLAALGGLAAIAVTALEPRTSRRLLLGAALLWLIAAPQVLGTWILDDAFISFRYAKNLVAGAGLTFNPGEAVEGYTNFLWTITVAGTMALGLEPVLTTQILCVALALAVLLLLYHLGEAWWPGSRWSLLAVALLATNPAFLLYTARGSGMETAQVAFLTLGATWLIWRAADLRSGLVAGIGAAVVMLARPDAALVPIAGGLVLAAQALASTRRRQSLMAMGGMVAGALLLYGPYFAWRYTFYGYLLPNTFYAKTGATLAQMQRGAIYVGGFAMAIWLPFLSIALAASLVGLARWRARAAAGPAAYLWVFLALTTIYTIVVGGDHFPLGRFFIAALPALVLLATHGASVAWAVARGRTGWSGPVALGATLLSVALFAVANVVALPATDSRIADRPIWSETKVALKNADYGYWFNRHTAPGAVITTGIAGALPYYADRYVIDALGLNDVHIAHMEVATIGQGEAGAEKTDVEYILGRRPDYIPFSSSGVFEGNKQFESDYDLLSVPGPKGGTLGIYKRRQQ